MHITIHVLKADVEKIKSIGNKTPGRTRKEDATIYKKMIDFYGIMVVNKVYNHQTGKEE